MFQYGPGLRLGNSFGLFLLQRIAILLPDDVSAPLMIFASIAALPALSILLGAASLGVWVYLLAARSGFWRVRDADARLDFGASREPWPPVIAVVPARNEAGTVSQAIASLLRQDYPGQFAVVLVDNHSEDETARIAEQTAAEIDTLKRLQTVSARELPQGWTGKVWALSEGVSRATAPRPEFYWFTDADVAHAPDTLRRLAARAARDGLDLASLMVLLRCRTFAERALIPAFLPPSLTRPVS